MNRYERVMQAVTLVQKKCLEEGVCFTQEQIKNIVDVCFEVPGPSSMEDLEKDKQIEILTEQVQILEWRILQILGGAAPREQT